MAGVEDVGLDTLKSHNIHHFESTINKVTSLKMTQLPRHIKQMLG